MLLIFPPLNGPWGKTANGNPKTEVGNGKQSTSASASHLCRSCSMPINRQQVGNISFRKKLYRLRQFSDNTDSVVVEKGYNHININDSTGGRTTGWKNPIKKR